MRWFEVFDRDRTGGAAAALIAMGAAAPASLYRKVLNNVRSKKERKGRKDLIQGDE